LDPDPHSECRSGENEEKNGAKRQIIRQKSIKINVPVIGIKMFIVALFSLKFSIFFYFDNIFVFKVPYIHDPDPHSPKKLDPEPHKVNADPKH
jgi:hypothetical protein